MTKPQRESPASPEPLIRLNKVGKTYHSTAGDFPALKSLEAEFFPSEFVSVMGKSGSGKSTLVNMITGIDQPSSGQVLIEGVDIHQMSESQRAAWRGLNLGIIFQFFQLLPNLTLLENVMLPMDFCHKYLRAERPDRARSLLAQVGLAAKADALPGSVSGGEQQRAAIARALANDPPIVVADEPTGNLDSNTAASVYSIFEDLIRRGKSIIMVTHDPELAEKTHRQLLLADGELIHPAIAATLDFLPHRRMLWLTHQMKGLELPAGASLNSATGGAPGLLLITEGALELNGSNPGRDKAMSRLDAGTFISTLDWNGFAADLGSLHSVAGANSRLLWLPQANFERWLREAPEEGEVLAKQRQARSDSVPHKAAGSNR